MPITRVHCPQCHRPTVWEGNDFRPFCSERCRLIDLGGWVNESYRIADNNPCREGEVDENNL